MIKLAEGAGKSAGLASPESMNAGKGEKMWSMTKNPMNSNWQFHDFATKKKMSINLQNQPNPLMSGITALKDAETGKKAYFTWRTATDARMPGKPDSWMHPGVRGKGLYTNLIPDLIKDAEAEIKKRISEMF